MLGAHRDELKNGSTSCMVLYIESVAMNCIVAKLPARGPELRRPVESLVPSRYGKSPSFGTKAQRKSWLNVRFEVNCRTFEGSLRRLSISLVVSLTFRQPKNPPSPAAIGSETWVNAGAIASLNWRRISSSGCRRSTSVQCRSSFPAWVYTSTEFSIRAASEFRKQIIPAAQKDARQTRTK